MLKKINNNRGSILIENLYLIMISLIIIVGLIILKNALYDRINDLSQFVLNYQL